MQCVSAWESKKERKRKRKRSYVCVNASSLLYVLLNMLQGNQESFVINWKQKHYEVTETKERKKKNHQYKTGNIYNKVEFALIWCLLTVGPQHVCKKPKLTK